MRLKEYQTSYLQKQKRNYEQEIECIEYLIKSLKDNEEIFNIQFRLGETGDKYFCLAPEKKDNSIFLNSLKKYLFSKKESLTKVVVVLKDFEEG